MGQAGVRRLFPVRLFSRRIFPFQIKHCEVTAVKRGYPLLSLLFTACFSLLAAAIVLQSGAALAGAAALLLLWVPFRFSIKRYTLWLFLCSYLLQLCVILTVHTPVISDFAEMYQAAEGLLEGVMPYQTSPYFNLWPYQTGFVLWETMWLSIWNDGMILRLVHALMGAGMLCLLYRYLLPMVRKTAAQAAMGLLAVFPMFFTLPLVLTNQIAGAFFIVLAVWLLACPDADRLGFWRYPAAGLSLFVSNFLRPEALAVLVAVLAWTLFSLFREPKRWKRGLLGCMALLAVFFAAQKGADALLRATDLSPAGLENPLPEWKFVCGLNTESSGSWSLTEFEVLEATFDADGAPTAETKRLAREIISQRLQMPLSEWLGLLQKKLSLLWYQRGLYWAFSHTQNGSTLRSLCYRLLEEFDRALFFLALALAVFGLWWRKPREPNACLPHFIVFSLACVFLLIEVQPRYAYLPQIFLFTAAAFGIDGLYALRMSKGGQDGDASLSGDSLLQ